MKRTYMILLVFVMLVSVAAVSAADNQTQLSISDDASADVVAISNDEDTLEKTFFYDADTNDEFVDNTVVTHNVVKYYGDTETRFNVKFADDDGPMGGINVRFDPGNGRPIEKLTNSKGIASFPINYKVGKYYVWTDVECADGKSYWYAENSVKIKSTIPTKELVKFSTSHNKFKIKFLDTKGKALKGKVVKIKKNGHWYKVKTDSKGYANIRSTFKIGKQKIVAYNPVSKEKRKISVIVLKRGVHKVSVKIVDSDFAIESKRLKNGDYFNTVYETKYRQYNPGVYVEANCGSLSLAKHTKLLKAKFYFENQNTGKIITKTSKKAVHGVIVVKPINGYVPYKVKVWYRDIK